MLSGLRAALGEKLLLVTFRTKAEGGETSLTPQQYADFCGTVCVSGCADLLDVELFPNQEELPALIGQAHKPVSQWFVPAMISTKRVPDGDGHTPDRHAAGRSRPAQAGCDAPKPHRCTGVADRHREMADLHAETPVITMSMGALGAVSRLAGETFGSAMTFANPGQASAPGQVSLDIVNEVLDALHL